MVNAEDIQQDNDWFVYPRGHMTRNTTTNGKADYYTGSVYTWHGIVHAYTQGDEDNFEITILDFIYQGRHYRRRFLKRYSKRYIVTLARRFAREKVYLQSIVEV